MSLKNYLGELGNRLHIEEYSSVTSTNLVLKQRAEQDAPEGTVIIADRQTEGRGRYSRKFYSPQKSGIYMSILLRPKIPPDNALLITTAAAVAVAKAAENLSGKKASVKWVNDVLIADKKICGILTEGSIDAKSRLLSYAVLGIGINAFLPENGFDREIEDIAGYVFENYSADKKDALTAAVLTEFFKFYESLEQKPFLEEYRNRLCVKEKQISVIRGDKERDATAIDIDENFRLLVKYPDESLEYLSSGEISTRVL